MTLRITATWELPDGDELCGVGTFEVTGDFGADVLRRMEADLLRDRWDEIWPELCRRVADQTRRRAEEMGLMHPRPAPSEDLPRKDT